MRHKFDLLLSFLKYVPDDMKDDKYWARRRKNNMAAKRSRDARRVKENQIAMRAAFLEKEVVSALFQFKLLLFPLDIFGILLPRLLFSHRSLLFSAICVRFYFSHLSAQNAVLKAELDKVTKLYAAALKRLEQYEKPGGKKC